MIARALGSLLLLALAAFVTFIVGFAVIRGMSMCLLDALRRIAP